MSTDEYRDLTEVELDGLVDAIAAGHVVYDLDAPAPTLPPVPDTEAMVGRSVRLPAEVDARIKAAAARHGVPAAALIRGWIDQGLVDDANDQPISRADALRALAGLPPLRAA